MLTLIPAVISIALLCCIVGLWLSLPAGVPFAPSQRFIDALPSWLQGPRRSAPPANVRQQNSLFYEELLGQHNDASAPDDEHDATQYHLPVVVAPASHEEAVPVEVVHDEP